MCHRCGLPTNIHGLYLIELASQTVAKAEAAIANAKEAQTKARDLERKLEELLSQIEKNDG